MFEPSGFGRVIWRNAQVLGIQGSWFGKTVLKKWRSNAGRPAKRASGGFFGKSFPGVDLECLNRLVLGELYGGMSWFWESRVLGSVDPEVFSGGGPKSVPIVGNYWAIISSC